MRVRNRLLNFGNYIIYQDDDFFSFSLDSLLLANFVTIKLRDKKILDLCTGNAPIPMLLSFKTKASIIGLELQKEIFCLGEDSVKENGLDSQINLVLGDVMDSKDYFDSESFDIITCNPPYFKYKEGSLINDNYVKTVARHEVKIKLDDILSNASYLLKNGGTFAMVHRPDRLMEIIDVFKKYKIEPKKIRFVYPKMGTEANILLIEGIKNGNTGLKILPPLISHNEDGSYTDEIRLMFGGDNDVAD